MPIEIRELVIKASITAEGENNGASGKPRPDAKEISFAEIVERVLQVLKDKKER